MPSGGGLQASPILSPGLPVSLSTMSGRSSTEPSQSLSSPSQTSGEPPAVGTHTMLPPTGSSGSSSENSTTHWRMPPQMPSSGLQLAPTPGKSSSISPSQSLSRPSQTSSEGPL